MSLLLLSNLIVNAILKPCLSYSSDHTSSDFCLFLKMKDKLRNRKFNTEVISEFKLFISLLRFSIITEFNSEVISAVQVSLKQFSEKDLSTCFAYHSGESTLKMNDLFLILNTLFDFFMIFLSDLTDYHCRLPFVISYKLR